MKKYYSEFIGTFFIVLTVVLATNHQDIALMAPFAIGGMLAVMTYAGNAVSGAHFNPAVTLALLISRKIERNEAAVYMIVQILAGAFAAAISAYLHGAGGEPDIALHSNHDPIAAGLAEFLGAFVVAYVFLTVAPASSNGGNTHYGLAIGLALTSAIYGFGGISGGVFNPAVAIGASLTGMYAAGDLWMYLVGAFGGAAAAATVFSGVRLDA